MIRFFLIFILILSACSHQPKVADYQPQLEKFNTQLELANLDLSPETITNNTDSIIKDTDAQVDHLIQNPTSPQTFENTLMSLQFITTPIYDWFYTVYFVMNTSPNQNRRTAAEQAVQKLQKWEIDFGFRKDVYDFVSAYAKRVKKEKLLQDDPIKSRYLTETMNAFKRNGLHLSQNKRDQLKKLKNDLSLLEQDFDKNIREAQQYLTFKKADLLGIPEEYLKKWKSGDDSYRVDVKIYADARVLMRMADLSETRKKAYIVRNTLEKKKNGKLMNQIIRKRAEIARKLGYNTWAHYKLENQMAKTPAKVNQFLARIDKGLNKKYDQELAEILEKKVELTGNKKSKLYDWDVSYYFDKIKKQKYELDPEVVKNYFPMEASLQGMFNVYQQIFNINIVEIDPGYKWIDDLRLYLIEDKITKEPLGAIYFDLYPREGKFGHFAQFTIHKSLELKNGKMRRPVVALVCNFSKPTDDTPSLLAHSDLETLFHEFGHGLHNIFSKVAIGDFSGTNVPRDFVEAPSQMLENWVWDKKVLDQFASHYKTKEKIPEDLLEKMKKVDRASKGQFYKFQLAIAMSDMALHTLTRSDAQFDAVKETNKIYWKRMKVTSDPGISFYTRIGHLTGYDAGYYGYLWAQAISDDMASIFKSAKDGFFDQSVGMRLRNEVYKTGNTRDVQKSVETFLGRKQSLDAFFENLGI